MIISPFSVAGALALLTIGTNGKTFNELSQALQFPGDKNQLGNQYYDTYTSLLRGRGRAQFSVANVIYVQKGYSINKLFQATAKTKFNSGIAPVDFEDDDRTTKQINSFVLFKTNGKIRDFIPPNTFTADTRIMLVNAIYFKGDWLHQFNQKHTKKGDFHVVAKQTVSVDFMTVYNTFNSAYLADLNANAIEMKYANSKYSFVLVLPEDSFGLAEMETKLQNTHFKTIIDQMTMDEVQVTIPKFKVAFQMNLNQALKNVSNDQPIKLSHHNSNGIHFLLDGHIKYVFINC